MRRQPADTSKDGQVSFIEFRRAVQKLRGSLEQRLAMYVRIFDSGGSGSLDHSDVTKLIAIGMPSAGPDEACLASLVQSGSGLGFGSGLGSGSLS